MNSLLLLLLICASQKSIFDITKHVKLYFNLLHQLKEMLSHLRHLFLVKIKKLLTVFALLYC